MVRGSNLSRLGDFNQTVVLDAIRRSPDGVSRVELTGLTGLTAQTVGNIVRRLLEAELVEETGRVPSAARGKPRVLLQVRPAARFAVGVHVDPAILTYVLIDLQGRVRQYAQRPNLGARQPQQVVAAIADQVATMITAADVPEGSVLGLGVAAPGPLDVTRGVLLNPPQLAGWDQIALRADLHAATGLHVLLDKDVTAAATGERWAARSVRAQGSERPTNGSDFLFCYLGAGVAAGFVVGGAVLRGVSNNIGEIGNMIVDPDGDDVGFGIRGSLASACVPQALVIRARRRGLVVADIAPDDFVAVDRVFTEICERAYADDPGCTALLDEAAVGLATGLAVLLNALDLDRVVLGGPIWSRVSSRFLAELPGLVQPQLVASRTPVVVEGSAVGEHVAAQGAAALVLDHFLSPRPSALVME